MLKELFSACSFCMIYCQFEVSRLVTPESSMILPCLNIFFLGFDVLCSYDHHRLLLLMHLPVKM